MQHIRQYAVTDTLPVLFGYVPMGMAFGLLLESQGYGWYWATAMGVFIFAGAAQFLAVGLLAAHAGLLEVAVTTLLLNSRHVFYGLSMLARYRAKGMERFYLIFGLTDETYSLLSAQTRTFDNVAEQNRYQLWVTGLNHSYWVVGCTSGALLGTLASFNTRGLEFTLPALFLVLAIEQYKVTRKIFPFVIATIAATVSLTLFETDNMLLISISLTLCLLLGYRKKEVQSDA
ncbi:MAG: branched-chain amino acid transporter AzlC [Proteobacteria bacterium]|nr:MAG: branched-chain amino acid transporter AzlC [Pseudomonadota bacterium]PIE40487.1 MAG: branched-chain amino acid transporter AzlC [Gammaproteobacteria bacterium]